MLGPAGAVRSQDGHPAPVLVLVDLSAGEPLGGQPFGGDLGEGATRATVAKATDPEKNPPTPPNPDCR